MIKRIKGNKKKLSFKNKVVWITGASSGIGEALTYAFARKGANLILSSRNKKALEKVKNNCTGSWKKVHILPLDLARLKTLNKKAKKAVSIFGRVDVMVHNAGVALRDLAVNTDIQIDKRIMAINYFAAVVLTKSILPSMLKRGSGRFAVPGFVRTNITVNALKGDGTRYGKQMQVQEKGLNPSAVAAKILEKMEKNKEEVFLGRLERLGIYCQRLFPVLFSKIIRNHPIERSRSLKRFFSLKKAPLPSPTPLTRTLAGRDVGNF
jgi:short-subunit dehydrogenase